MSVLLGLEQALVLSLNQLALSSGFLLSASRFIAIWAIFGMVAFYAASLAIDWSFIRASSKLLAIEGALASGLAWIVNQLIALVFFRERPYVSIEQVQTLIGDTVTQKSFPSDHTTIAFVLATLVFLWSPKIGVWFIAIAALIGFSRIVVGVHYPTDVIAGMVIGVIVAYGIHKFIVS